MNFVLVGSYKYEETTAEWYGMVAKQDEDGTLTVLTVGAEDSEFAIASWVKDTITMMRAEKSFVVQAADKYDRARKEEEALRSIRH